MPRIIWGPSWLESLSLLLGAWSCPTIIIPSDQLSIAYFCKQFLSLPWFPWYFHGLFVLSFLLDSFYDNKHIFFRFSLWIWFPFNPEKYARLPFLLWELFSPPLLTIMVYKTSASSLAKPASCPDMAGNMNWSFSNKSFSTYARRHIQGRSIDYPITRQQGAQRRSLLFWRIIVKQLFKPASGSSLLIKPVWWLWVVPRRFSFLISIHWLEINSGPVDSH